MTITPDADNILWLDFETTGLMNDPNTVPLEGAAIITDGQLNELATFQSMVIHATEEELSHMGEFVTNMHTTTGLLEKVRSSTITREEFDVHLRNFAAPYFPAKGDLLPDGTSYRHRHRRQLGQARLRRHREVLPVEPQEHGLPRHRHLRPRRTRPPLEPPVLGGHAEEAERPHGADRHPRRSQ
jgi:hypothetical protein